MHLFPGYGSIGMTVGKLDLGAATQGDLDRLLDRTAAKKLIVVAGVIPPPVCSD
jgi:hypothetical protein